MTELEKQEFEMFIFLYCSVDGYPPCQTCDHNLETLAGNKACVHPANPLVEHQHGNA